MIRYSVLIPQRDATSTVAQLLPQLHQALERLVLPYEIVCVDDASRPEQAAELEELLYEVPSLRLLRFDQPRGTSAAITAALAASRGEIVIVLDPTTPRAADYLPHMIARLSQFDLVEACTDRSPIDQLRSATLRSRRLVLGDADLAPGENLFWAARREALAGLALTRGAFRGIAALVASRGWRVCRLLLAEGLNPQGAPYRPNVLARLGGQWLARRFEPHLARELVRSDEAHARLRMARTAQSMPQRTITLPQPVQHQQQDAV